MIAFVAFGWQEKQTGIGATIQLYYMQGCTAGCKDNMQMRYIIEHDIIFHKF